MVVICLVNGITVRITQTKEERVLMEAELISASCNPPPCIIPFTLKDWKTEWCWKSWTKLTPWTIYWDGLPLGGGREIRLLGVKLLAGLNHTTTLEETYYHMQSGELTQSWSKTGGKKKKSLGWCMNLSPVPPSQTRRPSCTPWCYQAEEALSLETSSHRKRQCLLKSRK